jgi:mRNA-binding protein PUF3
MLTHVIVEDDDDYQGTTGSGALAASSEALWSATWNVDKTSPTMSTSGSASPERHRGSGPLLYSQTSPYLTASRTTIGQGSGLNNSRSPGKSSLDPASGPFKYPLHKTTFGLTDDKENMGQINSIGQGMDSYGFERAWRSNSSASRDNSGPPSRHSESGSSGVANGSFLGNSQYFGHTPNNSLQIQRPPAQSRAASFASSLNGRGYIDLNDQLAELSLGVNRSKESYLQSSVEHHPSSQPSDFTSFPLQSHYGSVSTWPNSSSRSFNGYLSDNPTDGPFSDQLSSSKPFRFGEHEPTSPGNNYRSQQNRPGYSSANDKTSAELEQAALRHLRPHSVTEPHRELHRHQFPPQQQYYPPPHVVYNGQFQAPYPPHAYDYPPQHNFPITHQNGYQMPAPPYTSDLPPRGPARDQEFGGFVLRSQLLEEFRVSSKTNRRYELKVSSYFSVCDT